MKAIIHKSLHYLNLIIVVIILIFTVALSFLWLLDKRIENHREEMAAWASAAMSQPIKIGSVSLTRFGIEPVLQFHDVLVFNDLKTKVLVRIKKLEIGIDLLASLLKAKILPGFLAIDNTSIFLTQADGHIHMRGVSDEGLTNIADFSDMIEWLFTQGHVRAKNIKVFWHPEFGKPSVFTNIEAQLTNDILGSGINLSSKIDNPDKSYGKFKIVLRLHGNIVKQTLNSVTGKLTGENVQITAQNAFSNLMTPFLPKKASIEFAGEKIGINWLMLENNQSSRLPLSSRGLPAGSRKSLQSNSLAKAKWVSLFHDPITFAQLSGKFVWQTFPTSSKIKVENLVATNPWLNFQSNLIFIIPTGENADNFLNFTGFFQLTDFTKAKLYYPEAVMDADLLDWLNKAFLAGSISGNFAFIGPPSKFPFDNNEGTFYLDGKFNDATLFYHSNWPKLEHMQGGILFKGRSMKIVADSLDIMGAKSATSTTTIANLDDPVLEVTGKVASDSKIGQKFVRNSPLQNTMSRFLKNTEFSGPMQLDLDFSLPLTKNATGGPTAVNGILALNNNQLQVKPWKVLMKNLGGKIHFTLRGVEAPNLGAELYNYPVFLAIKTVNPGRADMYANVDVKGKIAAQTLQEDFAFPFAKFISGTTNYNAKVRLYKKSTFNDTLEVSSDLVGIAVDLPKPFAKTAESKFPTTLKYMLNDNVSRLLQLSYGDLFTASEQIVPVGTEPQWLVKVANKNAEGSLTIPKNFPKGKIVGDFSRLYLEKSKYDIEELNPKKMSALEFKIKDFRYLGLDLGKAEFNAVTTANGLKIDRLNLNSEHFSLIGKGQWEEQAGHQKSSLRGSFSTPDLGILFKDWDLTDVLVGGKANLGFAFSWPGPFYDISLKNIRGPFAIRAQDGRIIHLSKETEANLGFGRVLGLLSLQNLPKRLTFDFSDLTKAGFVFDMLQGDCQMNNGSIYSDNFLLDGPVAVVRVKGRIGLIPKDYDIELGTVADVTSSFPVIATIAGGPVAGLATFMAHKFVSSQAGKSASYSYHITGPWSNPKVQDIEQ